MGEVGGRGGSLQIADMTYCLRLHITNRYNLVLQVDYYYLLILTNASTIGAVATITIATTAASTNGRE